MITESRELEKRTETLIQDAAPSDLPLELCHYRDDGCEFAVSCLACPFSKCLDEEPGGRKRYLKLRRDTEIVRLHKNEGKAVRDIASMFHVSRRTVQRILQSSRKNSKNGNIG